MEGWTLAASHVNGFAAHKPPNDVKSGHFRMEARYLRIVNPSPKALFMKPILTERLSLTSLKARDAAFLLALINTPSWIKYIGDRQVHSLMAAKAYLKKGSMQHEKDHGFGMRKMTLTATGQPIGICGIVRREGLPLPDLGFALLPEHEGHGYAFEAARSVLAVDAHIWNITEVSAITTLENDRSIALLHRLGFIQEGDIQLPDQKEVLAYFHMSLLT